MEIRRVGAELFYADRHEAKAHFPRFAQLFDAAAHPTI